MFLNSNYSVSGLYYCYIEGVKQPINTDATIFATSNSPLSIVDEINSLIVPVSNISILKQHRTGLSDNEPTYQLNPFFNSLVGVPVKFAQVTEENKYWLLSGTISGINGTDVDNATYQLTSLSVTIAKIDKPKYTAFASTKGTLWCDNGSILNLVLFLQGSNGYLDKTMLSELQKDWDNISLVNLINNKIYISRKINSKERTNFVDEWELMLEGNQLSFRRIEERKGDIFQFKKEASVKSVSYFPPPNKQKKIDI